MTSHAYFLTPLLVAVLLGTPVGTLVAANPIGPFDVDAPTPLLPPAAPTAADTTICGINWKWNHSFHAFDVITIHNPNRRLIISRFLYRWDSSEPNTDTSTQVDYINELWGRAIGYEIFNGSQPMKESDSQGGWDRDSIDLSRDNTLKSTGVCETMCLDEWDRGWFLERHFLKMRRSDLDEWGSIVPLMFEISTFPRIAPCVKTDKNFEKG